MIYILLRFSMFLGYRINSAFINDLQKRMEFKKCYDSFGIGSLTEDENKAEACSKWDGFFFFFLNVFGGHIHVSYFGGTGSPIFGFSGGISSRFQSPNGFCLICFYGDKM